MTDLPIAPDESSGEPRCWHTCPQYSASRGWAEWCHQDPARLLLTHRGDLCLPRVRELVAISRRRCDGCEFLDDYRPMGDTVCLMWGSATDPGESCSHWEARKP